VIIFLILVVTSIVSVIVGIPYAKESLPSGYSIDYYHYKPTKTLLAAAPNTAGKENLPPANAVPVLMYHGVIDRVDAVNTTIDNFISHMETLKSEGYTTISVRELDLFRQGKFVLPPKPIIITFDDGRKDSYYTTDDVLRQLGFKATIFVATGPIIEGNPFYLTWEDLNEMKATGRWEIEAHGRESHEKIPIGPDDSVYGRYLTSRMYLADQKRLETVAEFEKRVEEDYLNGINDLKTHVGVTPQYFAIPLNDYGEQSLSNYPGSITFNEHLLRKYFRLGLVQSNDNVYPAIVFASVYNFAYTNPYSVYRLEVENLSTKQLMEILDHEAPVPPELALAGSDFKSAPFNQKRFAGQILYLPTGLSLTASEPSANGQIIFGQNYWRNYETTAVMQQIVGRSVVLLFNFQDQKNYLAFGRSNDSYFLQATVNGVTTDLRSADEPEQANPSDPITLTATSKNGFVTGSVNGRVIFSQVAIPVQSGAVGFKVWDKEGAGAGLLQKLSVKEI
jgi:peptidoglycan/xylan/chitin deacetylase (PgdA/CDA1 family)